MDWRSHPPPVSTFVIRFWREISRNKVRWRGWILHVPSGKSANFLRLDAVSEFVKGFGVMFEDDGAPGEKKK